MFGSNVVQQGGTTTVEVSGAVDVGSRDAFGGVLDGAIADSPEVLVVDLSGVPLMDSYGFAVLVGIRNELRGSSTRLEIGNRSPAVERLFQLMKLADTFEFDPPLT